jgi:hypothetical protein
MVRLMILGRKATAVITSMAQQREAGQPAGELAWFRDGVYGCLPRRADALFELGDAVLTAQPGRPLPYLSLEAAFRRGHGMIYQGLAEGRVAEDALRDLLVAVRPRDWPLVFAIDGSTIARPEAETSPGRAFHHAAGPHGKDRAVAGWSFQLLAQLCFTADSWTAPQDMVRVETGHGTAEAAGQIRAHAARLRAAGETGVPLYVTDAGYGAAELTWTLAAEIAAGQVQVLARVRGDRVMYRDPAPRPPGKRGRAPRHGTRFECEDPATWGEPDQELSAEDPRYGQVRAMAWNGLHPKLYCRGPFAGLTQPPVVKATLIRLAVTRLPGGRTSPRPIWLWYAGPGQPAPGQPAPGQPGPGQAGLDLCWRGYLHRYDLEHTFRFAKHGLGWDKARVRTPAQAARWTWLIITALTQLRLARPIAEDHRLPWEKPRPPGRLTPARVSRDFQRIGTLTGTPARAPKFTRAGPGRPKGSTSTPAPRHPVIRKAA